MGMITVGGFASIDGYANEKTLPRLAAIELAATEAYTAYERRHDIKRDECVAFIHGDTSEIFGNPDVLADMPVLLDREVPRGYVWVQKKEAHFLGATTT